MEYVQDITLDVNSNNAYTTIGAKQGDNGSRIINVHLTEDGIPIDLQQGWSAYFRFRKPDGKAVINDCELDSTNDIIKMTLTAQTLASAGRGYGDITIQEGSRILSSVSFIIIIMASPSVANEATSSNEFGFLNAVVNDASHIIYEAQAWAEGKRGSTEVYGEGEDFSETSTYTEGDYVWYDGQLYQFLANHAPGEWNSEEVDAIVGFFTFSYQSNAITGVNWIVTPDGQTTFFKEFKYSPGQHRIFNFTYTGNNDLWQLIITTYDGDAKSESEPIINTLATYGLVPTIMSGAHLAKNDTITVDLREPDHAYHNNAKYYANQAREHKNAILNLTVDAEAVYADEFADYKNYYINDYVWYDANDGNGKLFYRFIMNHDAGPWNEYEVINEIIAEKTEQGSRDHIHLKLPQGPKGDVNFVSFDIDPRSGQLVMTAPDYTNPRVNFFLNDDGKLCGTILD